jgi:uncharacterized membrane protein YedE/YeeE
LENFNPLSATIGGALIGLSAVLLWLMNGRIAGISGIAGGLLVPRAGETGWRIAFIAGLVGGPLLYAALMGGMPAIEVTQSATLLVVGGLLVGYGTRLGNGCTSGHGVCGLARLSPRSIVATFVFLGTALVTVFLVRHVIGG